MPMFLFRNSETSIEYCVTDSKAGTRLPRLGHKARWVFHAEIKNLMHASIYGVMDYEQAKRAVARKGYAEYTESRLMQVAI